MDKEAALRSTSTYLVERRLDMLPGLLTTDLCSLRSSEDHLAFSVIWEMDQEGNILSVDFFKSVIRSKASLTYEQAQNMLDAPNPTDDINASVNRLNRLARIFRQRRIDTGALTLASPEVRFKFDERNVGGNPTDVGMYQLSESNALVEEFMLLANMYRTCLLSYAFLLFGLNILLNCISTVAKKILRHFPTLAVLRRHQPPSREQFTSLVSAASAVGVHIDISTSKVAFYSSHHFFLVSLHYFNGFLDVGG